jgi:low temperature requirement protein LtrA
METSNPKDILREGGGPQRATFLELFFDLVFVFALTRVSQRIIEDLTSQRRVVLTEAGQTILLFLALWLVWILAAWVTSRYNPDRPLIQLVIIAIMFGSMVMAVALPEAFGERASLFAGAYVAVQLGRPLLLMLALQGNTEQQRIPARIVCWAAVSAVPWLVGAVFPEGPERGALWTLAIAIDYAGFVLGWPTPGLGRSRILGWPIAGEHLVERYQQFVLIALGESILFTGLAAGDSGFGSESATAFVIAFATTVLLWRIYFYRAGYALRDAVAASPRPAGLSLSATYTHLVMVAGIIATAVGYELVIAHPVGHLDPAWLAVIFGGPALFLIGRARFEYDVFSRVSWSRMTGLLVLVAVTPVMVLVPPLAAAVAATLVLTGIAVSDTARGRGRPPEPPSPRL